MGAKESEKLKPKAAIWWDIENASSNVIDLALRFILSEGII